jgi:hypothetical protein
VAGQAPVDTELEEDVEEACPGLANEATGAASTPLSNAIALPAAPASRMAVIAPSGATSVWPSATVPRVSPAAALTRKPKRKPTSSSAAADTAPPLLSEKLLASGVSVTPAGSIWVAAGLCAFSASGTLPFVVDFSAVTLGVGERSCHAATVS